MKTLVLPVVITAFMGIEVSSKPNPLNEAVGISYAVDESNGSLDLEGNFQGKGDRKSCL